MIHLLRKWAFHTVTPLLGPLVPTQRFWCGLWNDLSLRERRKKNGKNDHCGILHGEEQSRVKALCKTLTRTQKETVMRILSLHFVSRERQGKETATWVATFSERLNPLQIWNLFLGSQKGWWIDIDIFVTVYFPFVLVAQRVCFSKA